jgi:copper chaperone CopZ
MEVTRMTRLKIKGMTCGHCVASVKKALEGIPRVDKVDVTLHPGEATIEGSAEKSALIATIQEEGYQAEVIQ